MFSGCYLIHLRPMFHPYETSQLAALVNQLFSVWAKQWSSMGAIILPPFIAESILCQYPITKPT